MKNKEKVERRIEEAKRAISKNGQYISYRNDGILTFEEIYAICDAFKGTHHAKINYFKDGRVSYQCFIIQKEPFDLSRQGLMIYSDILF